MTPIWKKDAGGWQLLAPTGFPDEASLQSLVEKAPHVLPLAGSPRMVIVGREVMLGNGYADLIAVEPTGRLAIIEVKLARSSEARRAVVAQVLTYAAYLNGLDPAALERDILASHLGVEDFDASMEALPPSQQVPLERLRDWAVALKQDGLKKPQTVHSKMPGRLVLLIRLADENSSLATIYNNNGAAALQVWSRALQRRAPKAFAGIEQITPPEMIGHGKHIKIVSQELLDALSKAYNEAVEAKPPPPDLVDHRESGVRDPQSPLPEA